METKIVTCPHCQTKNRVPIEKSGEAATCGRCHQPLMGQDAGEQKNEILTLRCSQCRVKNRVPFDQLNAGAKCGRCGAPLQYENVLSGQAMAVTEANFPHLVLQSPLPVLLYGWAPWCGHCQGTGPVVEAIAAEQKGKLRVAKLNIDQNPNLASRYKIMGVPAFFIFDAGEVKEHIPGAVPKQQLMAKLNRFLS